MQKTVLEKERPGDYVEANLIGGDSGNERVCSYSATG